MKIVPAIPVPWVLIMLVCLTSCGGDASSDGSNPDGGERVDQNRPIDRALLEAQLGKSKSDVFDAVGEPDSTIMSTYQDPPSDATPAEEESWDRKTVHYTFVYGNYEISFNLLDEAIRVEERGSPDP